MEELQEFSEKEESSFDLKAEIYKYLTHWKWLVFGCLLGLFIAFLYNRYTIPEFWTEASMMVLDDEDKNVVGALPSGGASILAIGDNSLDNQIVTLKSKSLVSQVIQELDLNISYFFEGNVIAIEAYTDSPVILEFLSNEDIANYLDVSLSIIPENSTEYLLNIYDYNYSAVHKFGEPVKIGDAEFTISQRSGVRLNGSKVTIEIQPLREVVDSYISRMTVKPMGKAEDILSLSISGEVPKKSQDFLNALMFHFNEEGVADKRQVAESTAQFIQERLELISQELDSVETGMAEFKRENQIMDVQSSAGQYLEKSSQAEQQIFDLETQDLILDGIEETLRSAEPYQLLPEGMDIESGNVSQGTSRYNELVLERNTYLKTGTKENPIVETITEQLDDLRQNLLKNIDQTRNSLDIKLRELNQFDQDAEGQFSTFPGLEKGIRGIVRQQQIKEQLYLFLLQRREESAISSAATSPVIKIIDPAWTYDEPVDPKPWLIMAGGGIIGLFVPLLIIFGINFLDTKVHHKGDLQPLTKETPFLGEIPRINSEEDEIIQVNDRSPLAESFRILRTNLAYLVQSRNREKAEVIFVTSTVKGEGKTFVSFNLSRTLASTGKKVLVVGADIRNPKLHKYSQSVLETKGLSDYLYNYDIQPQEIIHSTNKGKIPVDMIFSGAIPPNPAELLMNDRMESLLESQKRNYDFIIVDTAPTMIVTDTLLISQLADTTIYVTRAGYTERKLLEFPKDLKQQGKLKGLAVVLNDVDYSKFSYGAKYGYAYGYGYGYGVDEEKSGFLSFLKRPFKRN